MGALTEWASSRDNRNGYYRAKELHIAYGNRAPRKFLKEWDTEYWYHCFTGKKTDKFFLYYPWLFNHHPESIDVLKTIIRMHSDVLAYTERPCETNDFFLFHPPDEEIGTRYGLEVRNIGVLSKEDLNRLLGKVMIDDPSNMTDGIYLRFSW